MSSIHGGSPSQNNAVIAMASSPAALQMVPPLNYDVTLTRNTVLTLGTANPTQLVSVTLILRQSGGGGFAAVLPAGVNWAGGAPPALNVLSGNMDMLTFMTPDGGVTWFGS